MTSGAVTCRLCAEAQDNLSDILSLGHCKNIRQDLVLGTVGSEKPVERAEDRLVGFAEDVLQPLASATIS